MLLRAAVGPSGEVRNGDYVLDEERTRFDPAKDKQVIVLFQWQGTPGLHRMIVNWKSPDGASSSTRPVEYMAPDRRFGGYWPLTLSSTTAAGTGGLSRRSRPSMAPTRSLPCCQTAPASRLATLSR